MDNASGNKNWVVLAGLAALVCSGTCEKVKLSFGLPNHNHFDLDATIGNVILALVHQDLPTPSHFVQACKNAIEKVDHRILDVSFNFR